MESTNEYVDDDDIDALRLGIAWTSTIYNHKTNLQEIIIEFLLELVRCDRRQTLSILQISELSNGN